MRLDPQAWPDEGPDDDSGPRPEDRPGGSPEGPSDGGTVDATDLESGIPWAPPPA
jgi:hypothetical protein